MINCWYIYVSIQSGHTVHNGCFSNLLYRHPVAAGRPSFEELKLKLSKPQLLFSLSDHPNSKLGMIEKESLYPQLENRYCLRSPLN